MLRVVGRGTWDVGRGEWGVGSGMSLLPPASYGPTSYVLPRTSYVLDNIAYALYRYIVDAIWPERLCRPGGDNHSEVA